MENKGHARKGIYMNMGLDRAVKEAGSLIDAAEWLNVDHQRLLNIASGYSKPSKQWVAALSLYGRNVINADGFLDALKLREVTHDTHLTLRERRGIADGRAGSSRIIKLYTGELNLLLKGEPLPLFAQVVTQIGGRGCYDSGRLKFAHWELPFFSDRGVG